MDKLDMKTSDLTEENIGKIAKLFPNVITEKEGDGGETVKAIDFDLLKQELSKELVEDSNERYRLDWPGKKASLLKANTPIDKTLRPDRESSVDFDNTGNVYIEGDNFEVLKILQESYLGKVKMIYIDPPYNTGKDFVYRDNTTQSKEEYEEELGVEDEDSGKLFRNTDTNGRFHSDWLSMMYERLVVARDLLKDDGVIFMSIDDNEVHNLRKIGDEVFGEDNFIGNFIVNATPNGRDYGHIAKNHEFCLFYSKNIESCSTNLLPDVKKTFKYTDKKGGFNIHPLYNSNEAFHKGNRPNLYYPIYLYLDKPINDFGDSFYEIGLKELGNSIKIYPPLSTKNSVPFVWRWGKDKSLANLNTEIMGYKNSSGEYRIIQKMRSDTKLVRSILSEKEFSSRRGTSETENLFNGKLFSFPKPLNLVKMFLEVGTKKSDIVLDFFSGSATTANAVMQLNAEDGGNRKCISVQIPEKIDEKSEVFKAGYKSISKLGMERIRLAGKKILKDNADKLKERVSPLDIGFRVYKTDTTNMKDVYYNPAKLEQSSLLDMVDNIKEGRTPEDLLTQVILDLGLTLDLPIEKKKIKSNSVFFVADNSLVACFDENIDFGIVDEIAKIEPLKVVFRDNCFKDDKDRINVENRFKRLSPETVISVL